MATTKFYLKPEKKDGTCPILLVYQDKGKKFKYYTKVCTTKISWDGKFLKGKTLEILKANKRLKELLEILEEIEMEALQRKVAFNIDIVEQKFRLKLSIDSDTSEFKVLFEKFITDSVVTKRPNTIKGYKTTWKNLMDFSIDERVVLSFDNFNTNFYNRFVNYLVNTKGQLNNSVGKNIKNFKVFLNYAMSNDLIKHTLNLSSFKVLKEEIDIIALTNDELSKIYFEKKLPQNLLYTKDIFCFSCFTGLRFSDIVKLQNDNIKENFIELRAQKTKDILFIPLNFYAKEILKRYQGKFEGRPLPPIVANQNFNWMIKDIAEIAQVNEPMVIEKFSGSKCIVIKKQKCDLISAHTGRKTFITLSHEKGMSIEMIMKITGINNWATLKKYLKVSEKSKLIQMNEFWKKEDFNIKVNS